MANHLSAQVKFFPRGLFAYREYIDNSPFIKARALTLREVNSSTSLQAANIATVISGYRNGVYMTLKDFIDSKDTLKRSSSLYQRQSSPLAGRSLHRSVAKVHAEPRHCIYICNNNITYSSGGWLRALFLHYYIQTTPLTRISLLPQREVTLASHYETASWLTGPVILGITLTIHAQQHNCIPNLTHHRIGATQLVWQVLHRQPRIYKPTNSIIIKGDLCLCSN